MSPQQAPPSWTDFAAGLPKDLPDNVYDALRDKYFQEHVAPEMMAQGYGLDTVHQQWMEKTKRADKSSTPRAAVVASQAMAEMASPFAGGQPQLQESIERPAHEAAIEAQRQGIEPGPYQFAGAMLGQAPFWMAGMGEAGAISKMVKAAPLMEKAIKTAAGGIIQGSYDLLKTQNVVEGLKGAAMGAGMVAGFESAGPLSRWLTSAGLSGEEASAVESVAKGVAGPEQWQEAVEASLKHERLSDTISQWVGEQVKNAKQAGVAKSLLEDPKFKGLKIEMTGADGKPYVFTSPAMIEKTLGRMQEHLNAGGSIDQITGDPKAISKFYQTLSMSNPDAFDLSGVPNDEVVMTPKMKASLDVSKLINSRNSVYHATDLEGFKGILDSGQIFSESKVPDSKYSEFAEKYEAIQQAHPELDEAALEKYMHDAWAGQESGVSVSRTPRIASKADKAITFVIDAEKMPRTRPYVEEGYGKTILDRDYGTYGNVLDWAEHNSPEDFKLWNSSASTDAEVFARDRAWARMKAAAKAAGIHNEQFEFENRTYNEPIPLSAVRGIVVDRAAATQAAFDSVKSSNWGKGFQTADRIVEAINEHIQEITDLAQKSSIPVKVMDSGREVHSYRAGLAKQPEGMRWSTPLDDSMPDSEAHSVSYKETPLSHRFYGDIPEEAMPEGAHAATIPAGVGEKPSLLYRDTSKETIFHENLHGHYSYLGIDSWLNQDLASDPMVHEIFSAFPEDARYLYNQTGAIPEEVFTYAASAVRAGNETLLESFGEADTSKEHVLRWTADTSKAVLDKAAEAADSLHKRTLERRLGSVITRASQQLDDVNKPYVPAEMKTDIAQGKYKVYEGDVVHYFDSRADAVDYLESQFQEPFQTPELVPTQSLPDGLPRYALKVPASANKPPILSDPPPPDVLPRQPIKAGTSAFSFFVRPFYDWLADVSRKFERPDLYQTFSAVDDQIKIYNTAIRPYLETLRSTLGKYDHDRQTDFFKLLQTPEEHQGFLVNELKFTPQELADYKEFKNEFVDKLGGPFVDYIQKDVEKLQNAGYDFEKVYPKDEELVGGLLHGGKLDPRDTNLLRLSSIFLRSQKHGEIVEPALEEAEKLAMEKIDGRAALGQLAPLLKRQIAYIRGTPDFTQTAVANAVQATVDSINQGIEKINSKLPGDLEIPTIKGAPEDVMQKWITYSYAGMMGLRPGMLVRNTMQLFITTFPLLGNYTFKGMARAFETAKHGGESDAFQIAQKYGAFVEKASLHELISGGGDNAAKQSFAEKVLEPIRWTDNGTRLISFWGHAEKILDALTEHSHDAEAFTKHSDAWFMNEGMRAKYLRELPSLTPDRYEDFAYRMAADLTDQSQWNFRKGATPGMYRWQIGRLFGQFGTWPMNYIEYARRLAQGSDKGASMQALSRLVLSHGSILAAGASAGVDTSSWVFFDPMAYGGGPIMQAVTNVPSMMSGTRQGQEARTQLRQLLIFPGFVPGGQEAYSAWKAVSSNDPDTFTRLMGFVPTKD